MRSDKSTAQHTVDPSDATDGDLLMAFRGGNEAAYAELYRRRHLEIYRFILHFLHGDEDMAADMFQDTFIKVYNNAHTLRDCNTVRSWMYTIARNSCLNLLKRNGRQVRLNEQHANIADDDLVTPDDALERSGMHAALDQAIQALPDNQREAVILREFEGLSYSEIADATHTNVGIIRQRLWRAKQSLRTALAARYSGSE